MAGFCHFRILNFRLTAKPLYSATKRPVELLEWTSKCQKSFGDIKRDFMRTPALGLPVMTEPFSIVFR